LNRNEAIERAATNVLADIDEFAHVDYDNGAIQALREAVAMPKDCDLIFWNGPKYSFYTESLEMGEQIVKHLPNSDDFTATALSQKAMPEDAEPVAFINIEKRRLEWNTDFPVRFETPTIVKMDRLPLYAHPPKDDAERVALCEPIIRSQQFNDETYTLEAMPVQHRPPALGLQLSGDPAQYVGEKQ
jgi:hypothetical protein